MKPYEIDLSLEEAYKIIRSLRKRGIQPYQPIHLYPDFVTPHKKEGFKRRTDALLGAIGNPTDKYVLDLGCAVGWNLFELVFHGASGVGVDISENDIFRSCCLAMIYDVEDRTTFYNMDVFEFVMETNEEFDYALVLNLLNHIIDQRSVKDGWNMMKVISEKSDRMITNLYLGVDQTEQKVKEMTRYNRSRIIMPNEPYYCNMGRELYEFWFE